MHRMWLEYQAELSQLPPFFLPAAGGIDACRFDAAVSENVRKPHNVQHKRALALTARKLVRLVFRLLKDNRLYKRPEG